MCRVRRAHSTWSDLDLQQVGEVWRVRSLQRLVGDERYLVLDPLSDRQPVKWAEKWPCIRPSTTLTDHSCQIDGVSHISDMTSYILGGRHEVILFRKVLPSGKCSRSVCPAHMQQHPPVPALLYICTGCLTSLLIWNYFRLGCITGELLQTGCPSGHMINSNEGKTNASKTQLHLSQFL